MGYLLMILNNLIGGCNTILSKKYVSDTQNIASSKSIYILIAHPLAAIYFLIMSRGSVPLNQSTFLFSLAYATVCLISIICSLFAYEKTNLIYMTVFSGAGAVIIPFISELFMGMTFSLSECISIILRLCAVAVPLVFSIPDNKKGIRICILLFLIAGFSGIIPKLYAENPDVTTNESLCFWTNIFIIPIVFILILARNNRKKLWEDMKKIHFKSYSSIFICTAISNVSSIIMLIVLTMVNATTRAVFTSSVGMIITTIISVFIFKEKFRIQQAICIIFSIASITLNVL